VRPLNLLTQSRANARTAGLIRIGVAFAAILVWFEEAPVLAALNDPNVLHVPYGVQIPTLLLGGLSGVWFIAAAALAVGYRTRWAAALLVAVLTVTLLADQQLYSNHLYLLLILVLLVGLSDSGTALSVDARGRRAPATVPGWPIWLIRAQVTIVYAFAALAKVNSTYLSGTVIGAYLRDAGPLAIPQEWRSFQVLFMLALIGALAEAFLAIALWIPRWRHTAFLVGLGVHGSIAIWLEPTSQLITFAALMLPLYLAFLDPPQRSIAVVWDDQCSFCRRSITWARRLDWLHALRFVPGSNAAERGRLGVSEADALYALQVVQPSGQSGGYDGVARMAEVVPIAFLWAALLRLPPIAAVGRRVYRRIADRRSCGVHDHAAHIHAEPEPVDVAV
jgi:predicted DCC family thiol-disulfide oxidoreductase YuxK/uncharacterized membrane protein YphA (DoxX/SURF4 family)